MFIVNFIFGLLIATAGVLVVKYNRQVTHMFPKSRWLEQNVGMGATFGMYYLVGFIIIIYGALMMLSLHDNVTDAIFGPVFNSL